ncbi:rhodanese-like domain-containing protein [Variovorax sp. KK3]|uniref:rhodanese-like domain-containing protein n=1 Tax=Variovorax sp. KK3 TaxID=1855728 RepID=UPI00211863CB|nr:rhodanese-like domain-containing protein [Variovorax sp. KK3]
MSAQRITPLDLQALLLGNAELALLDVREARWFCEAHLNLARLASLSSLELQVGAFVPRRSTPVVLVDESDDEDGPAGCATGLLARLGYTRVRRLAGGLRAWRQEGLPVIDGYATLVKAFGDLARQHYRTPTLPLAEFDARRRAGRPITLIDARPREEYAFLSIAGARNYPGTELALRALPANAQDNDHLWAVNCFSRTRGILGATTLRLLGGANAVFLEDGVMAWGLRGGAVVQNADAVDDIPAESPEVLRALADRTISRHALSVIDAEGLARFASDADRSLYVFDLRPVPSQALPAGVRRVAGGQLFMHFENLVGTRNARIVLIDEPHRLRAAVTAFWLGQLNQAEIHVLAGECPSALSLPLQPQPVDDAPPGRCWRRCSARAAAWCSARPTVQPRGSSPAMRRGAGRRRPSAGCKAAPRHGLRWAARSRRLSPRTNC